MIFALYVRTGWVGVLLLHPGPMDPTIVAVAPSVALPWLPVGIGVAGLLRYRRRAWPGIVLGSLAVGRRAGRGTVVTCRCPQPPTAA